MLGAPARLGLKNIAFIDWFQNERGLLMMQSWKQAYVKQVNVKTIHRRSSFRSKQYSSNAEQANDIMTQKEETKCNNLTG